jgi:glycosyltransferase involved in cell wall biosynthesis
VVATRVGGIPEVVVEGETAFLVEPDDHMALAQRITELLTDPHLARAMGVKGKERVRTLFSMEAMVASTEVLYLDLLEKKGFPLREAPGEENNEPKSSPP